MASLFVRRKKSNIHEASTPVRTHAQPYQPAPGPSFASVAPSSSNSTPLYERFARKSGMGTQGSNQPAQKPAVSISRPMALGTPANTRMEYDSRMEGRVSDRRVEPARGPTYPSELHSHVQAQQYEQDMRKVSVPGPRASDRPSTAPVSMRPRETSPSEEYQPAAPPPVPQKSPGRYSVIVDPFAQSNFQMSPQVREPSPNHESTRRTYVNGRAIPQQKPQPTTPAPALLSPPTSPTSQRRNMLVGQTETPQQHWDSPGPISNMTTTSPSTYEPQSRLVNVQQQFASPPPPPTKSRSSPTLTPPREPVTLPAKNGYMASSTHVQVPSSQGQRSAEPSVASSAVNVKAAVSTTNLNATLQPENRLLSDAYAKPRQPRKYSPLAAFGLPLPGSAGLTTPSRSTDSATSGSSSYPPKDTKHEEHAEPKQIAVPNATSETLKQEVQKRHEVGLVPDADEQNEFHSPLFASKSTSSLSLGNAHQNISSPAQTPQKQISSRSLQPRRLPLPPLAPQSPPPKTPPPPPHQYLANSYQEQSSTRARTLSSSTNGSGKKSETSASRFRADNMGVQDEIQHRSHMVDEFEDVTVTPRSQKSRADHVFNESPRHDAYARPQMLTPPTSRDGPPRVEGFGAKPTRDVKGKGKQRALPSDEEMHDYAPESMSRPRGFGLTPGKPLIFSAHASTADPDEPVYDSGYQSSRHDVVPRMNEVHRASDVKRDRMDHSHGDYPRSVSPKSAVSEISANIRERSPKGGRRLRKLSSKSGGSRSQLSGSTPSTPDYKRSMLVSSPVSPSFDRPASQPLSSPSEHHPNIRDTSPTNGWNDGNRFAQERGTSTAAVNHHEDYSSTHSPTIPITPAEIDSPEAHLQHSISARQHLASSGNHSSSRLDQYESDCISPDHQSDVDSHGLGNSNMNGAPNGNVGGTKSLQAASKAKSLHRESTASSPTSDSLTPLTQGVSSGNPNDMLLGSAVDLSPWARPNTTPRPALSHSSSRKLQKAPPAKGGALRSPIDLATGERMGADADPFAKVEAVPVQTQRPTAANGLVEYQGHAKIPQPPGVKTTEGLPSPVSPESYVERRVKRRGERLEKPTRDVLETCAVTEQQPEVEASEQVEPLEQVEQVAAEELELEPEPEREPTYYPLEQHLTNPALLATLLQYLTFSDWCILTEVNDAMRRSIEHKRELRETVLEHFLGTVGYTRWSWTKKEPIMLTFRDLNSYMRGVSIPSHQYAISANAWLESKKQGDEDKDIAVQKTLLASSCRAFTRVVLRLRAQAEEDQATRIEEGKNGVYQLSPPQSSTSVNASRRDLSKASFSRPTSPTSSAGHSMFSSSTIHLAHGHSQHGHSRQGGDYPPLPTRGPPSAYGNRTSRNSPTRKGPRFCSPLYRLGHAPLLRVFVPSPEGEWLSDESVLDCEKELKRAGVLPLLRVGDVIWDTAVGDEGNVGRMVWDGNYLIDLDYTYSRTGELPHYLHTLSFPPSYFHRVIRSLGNPIVYIDLSPWAEEIATNIQLLQDRIRTETPQGGHHTVVRWIHRSRFRIKAQPYGNTSIRIPDTNLTVDPAWYGTVIVKTEGTNEGLADLQDRCKGGFPPRAGANPNKQPSRVFRLLRERSRPGEIWIRAVREKERIL